MGYRFLAPVYDCVAPRISRYVSPQVVASKVDEIAPYPCELLDVGIGTGLSVAAYAKSRRYTRIVGIDPSAAMIKRCRAKFPEIELHEGVLGDRQLGKFDVVQSCGAVEHIRDLGSFLSNVAATLKPGGYFVFTYEPIVAGKFWQSLTAPHLGTLGQAAVYRRKPEAVRSALAVAGFDVLEVKEFTAYLGLLHYFVAAQRKV